MVYYQDDQFLQLRELGIVPINNEYYTEADARMSNLIMFILLVLSILLLFLL